MVNGKLPITGLIAHTCVEATVRYAAEPGYEVTLVKDATADYSDQENARRTRRQYPKLCQRHCDTSEMVGSISSLRQRS